MGAVRGFAKGGQVVVHVRDQEGQIVSQGVTNDAGEFSVAVPTDGAYSVSALQGTLRTEYVILRGDAAPTEPLTLTLVPSVELALELWRLFRRYNIKPRVKPIR
jgi:hypothetical protein